MSKSSSKVASSGFEGKPLCRECHEPLQKGDKVDGYFPYFTENNLCKSCEDSGAKAIRKQQWDEEMSKAEPTDNKIEMWLAQECVDNLRTRAKWANETKNVGKNSINGYARGYREGMVRSVTGIIALSPVSKQAFQAVGLTFEEMEICTLEIIG